MKETHIVNKKLRYFSTWSSTSKVMSMSTS